jgi:hypothetical protein
MGSHRKAEANDTRAHGLAKRSVLGLVRRVRFGRRGLSLRNNFRCRLRDGSNGMRCRPIASMLLRRSTVLCVVLTASVHLASAQATAKQATARAYPKSVGDSLLKGRTLPALSLSTFDAVVGSLSVRARGKYEKLETYISYLETVPVRCFAANVPLTASMTAYDADTEYLRYKFRIVGGDDASRGVAIVDRNAGSRAFVATNAFGAKVNAIEYSRSVLAAVPLSAHWGHEGEEEARIAVPPKDAEALERAMRAVMLLCPRPDVNGQVERSIYSNDAPTFQVPIGFKNTGRGVNSEPIILLLYDSRTRRILERFDW